MYLFKTSGATFGSVIRNEKHAFLGQPREWVPGELVLVSKNRSDCRYGEKQIQYTMRIRDVRPLKPNEAERYWPGSEGRWRYLIDCYETKKLSAPFDFEDVLGRDANDYRPIMTFIRIKHHHESMISEYLERRG